MRFAFTLIEVLISIFLMSIIVLFLSTSLADLKKGYAHLYTKTKKQSDIFEIKELLYKDILQSQKIQLKQTKRYDILFLQTSNSLFSIDKPYVSYFVSKHNDSLVRVEDVNEINLPFSSLELIDKNFLVLLENLDEFKLNLPKETKKTMLISIFAQKKDPIIFELALINDVNISLIQDEL